MSCPPVALLIFNRPSTTRSVFEAIAKARPSRLLVVADGPRADRAGEREACAATRAVVERIDWECEVARNYSDSNLGCRARVATGLDWVFSLVPDAIVLEDDCVPSPSFFRYCEELLARYRDEPGVFHISGTSFQFGRVRTPHSYYFSRYPHGWGWATWRRAWKTFDIEMKRWPELRDRGWLLDLLGNRKDADCWRRIFDRVWSNELATTWDYQWVFHCWVNGALAAAPRVNLVSNIGFGAGATHTMIADRFANLVAEDLDFPLSHPDRVVRNAEADRFVQKEHYAPPPLPRRVLNKLKRFVTSPS